MTSNLDSSTRSVGDRRRTRLYLREFVPGIVAYVAVLLAVTQWGGMHGTSPWRFVWAVLPVVPMAWVALAVLRHARRIDDYERQQLLTGLAVGFAVAMLAAITLGVLDAAGLVLRGSAWWIYAAGMAAWLVTGLVGRSR